MTGVSVSVASVEPGTPPQVQAGDPKAKQAYATALDFEQMLVGELSQSLVQGSGLEGEGGAGEAGGEASGEGGEGAEGAGASPVLSALVPQALGESVMRDGGLGLAGALTRALDPAAFATAPAAGSDVTAAGGSTVAPATGAAGPAAAGPAAAGPAAGGPAAAGSSAAGASGATGVAGGTTVGGAAA